MYSSYSGPLISCRRAVGVCCLASSCNENGQQVRTQLDKLHFEADTARAKGLCSLFMLSYNSCCLFYVALCFGI